MQDIVVMGVGHVANFFIPLLTDNIIYGVSRSFSRPVNKQFNYNIGSPLPPNIPRSPRAVIWNFPPHAEYLKTLKAAETHFLESTPYIFISSTSIYKNEFVDESSELNPESRLYSLEKYLATLKRSITVLRPGGLFDSTRHPSRFFRNKTEVQGSESPVNMVHCEDLARFISHTLKQNLFGQIFNIISSTHPSKREFYDKSLKNKKLNPPHWIKTGQSKKIVDNSKSLSTGFHYIYDDLLSALNKL